MSVIFKYETTISEQHIDSFSHVNNAQYLVIYEDARWDFITKNGYGLERIRELQKGPVITELTLKFKKELVNREIITIESQYQGMKNRLIMLYSQRMLNSKGEEVSTLDFSMGLMDLEARKLINPTEEWLKAIGAT